MKRFKFLCAIGCGALLFGCGAEQDFPDSSSTVEAGDGESEPDDGGGSSDNDGGSSTNGGGSSDNDGSSYANGGSNSTNGGSSSTGKQTGQYTHDFCAHTPNMRPSTDCSSGEALSAYQRGYRDHVYSADSAFDSYGSCNYWSTTNGIEDIIDAVMVYLQSQTPYDTVDSCNLQGCMDGLSDRKDELADCCGVP